MTDHPRINTCGWDTDCNSGNLGCLVAIILGLDAFTCADQGRSAINVADEARKLDWRGPVADRALISSTDGGYSINNAARITYDLANLGKRLAGQKPFDVPKEQFHFSLPHSVQGFQLRGKSVEVARLSWGQEDQDTGLLISIPECNNSNEAVDVATDTFTSQDVLHVSRHYELSACPLVYPGQTIVAKVKGMENTDLIEACIRVKAYDHSDCLKVIDGEKVKLKPLQDTDLSWTIPRSLQNWPIQQVGVAIFPHGTSAESEVWLKSLSWTGTPTMTLKRPSARPDDSGGTEHTGETSFWEKSFVSSADKFHFSMGPSFFLAQSEGEGLINHGTREWTDYNVVAHKFTVNLGASSGVAVRVRGLNRWYGLLFSRGGKVSLIKARDELRTELASKQMDWKLDTKYEIAIEMLGGKIRCLVDEVELCAEDNEYISGGIGLIVTEGSISAESIDIGPVKSQ